MKTWQFIILLIAIFLQPVIIYFWFGYRSWHLVTNQVQREEFLQLENKINIIIDNQETINNRTIDILNQF